MIFPKTKKIAKELHWHKTKDSIFGLYKGYFFNVSDSGLLSNPRIKFVNATVDPLTEEQKILIKKELDNHKKNLKFTYFEINNTSIIFQFAENLSTTKLEIIYALFDFLIDLFKKLNVSEQNKCHNCGANNEISYYDLNDTGILLCNNCFEQTEKSFYEIEKKRISEERNYFIGFLGSIVFSIPAILVWVLIAVYLERLSSAMALIIAFIGLKGYDYFKGKQGKLTKYIIVFTNILSILLANAATVIALLMKEGLTFNQALTEFQTNPVAMDVFNQNTIISFILAMVVWAWLIFIMKDNKLTIKLADKFKD